MHSQARGQPEPEQRTCRSAHYRPPSSAQVSLGQSAPQLGIAFTSPRGSPNQNSAHADQHIIAHRALLVPLGQPAPQLGIAFTSPRAARTRTAHMQISTLSPTELCSGITGPVSATARHCIPKPEGSPNQNSAHADQHIIAHRVLLRYHWASQRHS